MNDKQTQPRFQRRTAQREIMLRTLRTLATHPTAAELHAAIRAELPTISLGTVYRNLDLLVRMGQVTKLESLGNEARYDGMLEPHYHARCLRCGRVDDIPVRTSAVSADRIKAPKGYHILGHRLELVGFCPACRSTDRRKRSGILPDTGEDLDNRSDNR
ncbi:MAG: transcriptional repressor [candidate division Zixibacteria bacterium]|nr:transcriptional repressor [candidate division Zixibacteria bacterium]